MEEQQGALYKWMALLVCVIGTFMSILDSSIVNIAIPKLMAVFGVSLDDVKWILTAYTLALGAIIPLTGYLGDILGTKKVFIFALIMFTVGSFFCGFAWSNSSMIVFRVIQALGGGMIMPVAMSIIYEIIPPAERGMALGFWGIASMAAPAIGPTLGGYIIEKLDWRLIFYVNVPIGIICVALAVILLKPSVVKPAKGFDWIGFISSTVGLVSILYVLGEGSNIDWSDIKNPLLLTLGGFCLMLFVVNELTHLDPLLDLRVFTIFDFSISQVISCITTFSLMGATYILPVFLQNMRGYTAMETGLIMLPSAVATGILMPVSGFIFDKVGAKPVAVPGLFLLAWASYELSFINLNTSKEFISFLLVIRGIGLGLSMMPINTSGMNAVPQRLVGRASALSNTIRQVMGSLSVTIMTMTLNARVNTNYARLSEQVTAFNSQAATMFNQLQGLFTTNRFSTAEAQGAATSVIYGLVYKQAYVDAMDYAIAITVVAVAIAIIVVFFMRGKQKDTSQNGDHPDEGEGLTHAAVLE
ncbi:EmrB/QacA subfamily drug resistance transporter [Hydrogenispora ethanolica]|uniref:EmrB/QacA subfamily drug resistance transporter n=1 Tax=Hydrogenispora ethanolica TaxID=1082276 RepID=A0A4V2QCD0_HYDET|nr:DHA2 family efflux MFS transporter permease subunit [Hydrogenispora ethanolica]TCL59727.1 EmrB/QacA subfamily drug resistance transporter [Hydrogenispora ethanolica]